MIGGAACVPRPSLAAISPLCEQTGDVLTYLSAPEPETSPSAGRWLQPHWTPRPRGLHEVRLCSSVRRLPLLSPSNRAVFPCLSPSCSPGGHLTVINVTNVWRLVAAQRFCGAGDGPEPLPPTAGTITGFERGPEAPNNGWTGS